MVLDRRGKDGEEGGKRLQTRKKMEGKEEKGYRQKRKRWRERRKNTVVRRKRWWAEEGNDGDEGGKRFQTEEKKMEKKEEKPCGQMRKKDGEEEGRMSQTKG